MMQTTLRAGLVLRSLMTRAALLAWTLGCWPGTASAEDRPGEKIL